MKQTWGNILDLEERVDLVSRNTEEVVTRGELRSLLETTSRPKAYWGFECSGLMHIGIGLYPALRSKT